MSMSMKPQPLGRFSDLRSDFFILSMMTLWVRESEDIESVCAIGLNSAA